MTALLSPLREGRITGSRVGAILGVNRYCKRADVLREMVRDYFGDPPEFTGNDATRYGQAHETAAIAAYEAERGVLVHGGQEIVLHPDYDFIAVTPDGLVEEDGMVEVKCPSSARYTHIDEKPEYEAQIRLQLACTERKWCDFVVWRDGEPLAVSRVDYDPLWLPTVLPKLERFIADYLRIINDSDLALITRLTGEELVAELFRQRDQARRIACELEAQNFNLLDTLQDRELAK